MKKQIKIINVVGTRPNFIKIAPILNEMKKYLNIHPILVHTGQHYDKNMSDNSFEDLEIPKPNYFLGVGSGSHAEQTANIMIKFEKVCLKEQPDLILVVGDVNSTIAAALVAKKLDIEVAHVEAGLRSFDRKMPEEINRILTDSISDYLFISEQSGMDNLKHEGINDKKLFFVGNVMIDSIINNLEKIKKIKILKKIGINKKKYAVLTLHRPSNVDNKTALLDILGTIEEMQKKIKIIFPIHPRTKKNIRRFKLDSMIKNMKNLITTNPLSYIDFLSLVWNSKFVLTDSGGIQEETTYFKVPCITLRENTERPSTINKGSNILVGSDHEKIFSAFEERIVNNNKESTIPELWDGKAAERIVNILFNELKKL